MQLPVSWSEGKAKTSRFTLRYSTKELPFRQQPRTGHPNPNLMINKKQWHNTSVDDGTGLGGRWRGAWQTAGRGSVDGGAEVGAWPKSVWGFDLGGVGLGTRRTAFLGDSVWQTAVRRSELGLRWCGARTLVAQGPDVGGVGLGTWRMAFLGDSVWRMAAWGSGDGSVRLGGRRCGALCGVRGV
ncbi:hypothetical protein GUJ93_ZPchr0016g2602 [Zizania palustris]|uniref:Uncharacterized protein n=1 Tax=Zizania palustris TaxID=103762 RepID=A0A8J5VT02_ZIZPA|nr:hypothetical protein GUJ93_ZPchr0016g2602 [Zizania palustris]